MPVVESPPIPDFPVYQLSVDKYHELIRTGVLEDGDRIELLHGWMVSKMSNNPPHTAATELTIDAIKPFVPTGYYIRSEKPITLSDSEPEPDVAVVIGNSRRYAKRHPKSEEIALVIEISDASLTRDRKIKKQIYAEGKIPCYWIVDVSSRIVEVYTQPSHSDYESREQFTDRVPLRIGDHSSHMIAVTDLLP